MRPIEPDCKCVIVDASPNDQHLIGLECVAVAPYRGFAWQTDIIDSDGRPWYFRTEALRRIDEDKEELTTWEHVEKTCHFNPTREVV